MGGDHDPFFGYLQWFSDDHLDYTEKAIYFDLDGTIVDLYGVDDWLPKLRNEDPSPYYDAPPIWDMDLLWDTLANFAYNGWRIGVVSWLSKECSTGYAEKIMQAKLDWCSEMLPTFHEIVLAQYGYPKQDCVYLPDNAILIDDELNNRVAWENDIHNRTAYDAELFMHTMSAERIQESIEKYSLLTNRIEQYKR